MEAMVGQVVEQDNHHVVPHLQILALVLQVKEKQVAPINTAGPGGGAVTVVGSGGGWGGTDRGPGGTGAGGKGIAPTMFGGGGSGGGAGGTGGTAGKQGVVVIRYPGYTVRATGGTVTYNASDAKTYHVFTSSGIFRVNT